MKRILFLTVFGLVAGVSLASAQPMAQGRITTNGDCVSVQPGANRPSITIQVSGTWTGTLTFSATADGGTFTTLMVGNTTSGATPTTTTANGIFSASNPGYLTVRACATATITGTATVTFTAGGAGGGAGGGGASGSVTQGTDPWIVAGAGTAGSAATGVVTVQGIASGTNLNVNCAAGCAAATSDPDDGSIAGGQTNSNANSLGMVFDGTVWRRLTVGLAGTPSGQVTTVQGITSGTPVIVGDGTGALNVICDSGCSGGVQYTQDAALTVATSVGSMAMGRASAAAPTDVSADNDAVMPWYQRSGAVVTAPSFGGILALAGNGASGTAVQRVTIANDSTGVLATVGTVTTLTGGGVAAGATDSGNPVKVGGIYSSSLPTLTNGQRGNVQLTANGAVITAPSLTGSFATDCTHDGTACSTGPQVMYAAAADGSLPTAVTAGDAVRPSSDLQGIAYTRFLDPCTALPTTTVPISVAADTAIITATASKRTYICGGAIVASGAEIFNLWEGTGSACGTSSAALMGSTTEANGMSLAANGGFEISRSIRGLSTNVDVCIRLNATTRVSGWLSYVQAP